MANGEHESFFRELMRERGVIPHQLIDKPMLEVSCKDLWEAFWILSKSRQIGFGGPQPIQVSEIKAYFDMVKEGEMEAVISEARLENGLCHLPPIIVTECLAMLHSCYQSRSLPRGTDFAGEVKSVSRISKLTPWQRIRRLIGAIQAMDQEFMKYHAEKAKTEQ